jgi:hypothetical protein
MILNKIFKQHYLTPSVILILLVIIANLFSIFQNLMQFSSIVAINLVPLISKTWISLQIPRTSISEMKFSFKISSAKSYNDSL